MIKRDPFILISMISLDNITSRTEDEILFTNLNNSFETSFIHGIWNETDDVNTGFLKLLAGNIPLSSGIIRYKGMQLDHADVAYYGRADMPGPDFKNEFIPYQNGKLVYLFDNIFDAAGTSSFAYFHKMILFLKKMGRTVLITSTDHKVLIASTDFFHILSKGAFQAKFDFRQYDLLDDVLKHVLKHTES